MNQQQVKFLDVSLVLKILSMRLDDDRVELRDFCAQ